MMPHPRVFAFYLPQYHPIPENDLFWGKGFTEWMNVTKAVPLFRSHHQPFLPSDLGFYDLRVPEVRLQQAELAHQAGIEGFCYWHYWFGNGKRALERIFDEVVEAGEPDFPFILGWANESWTGKWHGLDSEVIFHQTYPGTQDYIDHFHAILPAIVDSRYARVDGKPIFLIYRPENIPSFVEFSTIWNRLATDHGIPGFYWISNGSLSGSSCSGIGIDAFAINRLSVIIEGHPGRQRRQSFLSRKLKPHRLEYSKYCSWELNRKLELNECPVIYPNWDSTPRLGSKGYVLTNPDPLLFGRLLDDAVKKTSHKPASEQIIFIKSWNEWAEGNVMEPSRLFDSKFLSVCHDVLSSFHQDSF
jgi:hypothetical protein